MPASATTYFGTFAVASGTSPRSVSVDVGTGTGSRAVLVGIYNTDGTSDAVTAVTVGGESLSQVSIARSGTEREWRVWGGVITVTGTQSLEASFSGDGAYALIGEFAVFDDVASTGTFGTPAVKTNTGTGPNSDSATCPANGLIVSLMIHQFASSDPTYTGSGTSLIAGRVGTNPHVIGLAHRNNDGAHSWSVGSSQNWSVIMVPVNGASGGGGGGVPIKAFRIIHG